MFKEKAKVRGGRNARANLETLRQRAGLVGHDDEKLKLGGGGGGGHGADEVLCGGGDAIGHLQQERGVLGQSEER